MPMSENSEELITTAEAAHLLKVSRSTMGNLIRAGVIKPANEPSPVLKRAGRYFFRKAEVEALIKGASFLVAS